MFHEHWTISPLELEFNMNKIEQWYKKGYTENFLGVLFSEYFMLTQWSARFLSSPGEREFSAMLLMCCSAENNMCTVETKDPILIN